MKNAGYLLGAVMGPILYTVSERLPFTVMAAMNIGLIFVVGVMFFFRWKKLSAMDFDDDVNGNYLLMERANNNKADETRTAEDEEREKRNIESLRNMMSLTVTATHLGWDMSA